ncbi:MAG: ParB/RepB/Spo0J family partition protein [Erysipelotrichaceae bacterium]
MEILEIALSLIKPNPYQPRKNFSMEELHDLMVSIKENGLIQPIVVRPTPTGYEIVAGERRYRATKLLNFETINCIVESIDDQQSAALALVENIQREDLSSIEEALAYQRIIKLKNITQSQLSQEVGKTQSTIANKLRLLNLNPHVQEAIISKKITERHGRALLDLDQIKQVEVLKEIMDKNITVNDTEKLINSIGNPKKKKSTIKGFNKNYRLLYNSINQEVKKFNGLGYNLSIIESEDDDEYNIVIKLKK